MRKTAIDSILEALEDGKSSDAKTWREAIPEIERLCVDDVRLTLLPWYKSPVVIKSPTVAEWVRWQSELRVHRARLHDDNDAKASAASLKISQLCAQYAIQSVVYPVNPKLLEIRETKLDFAEIVWNHLCLVAADDVEIEHLKLHGR